MRERGRRGEAAPPGAKPEGPERGRHQAAVPLRRLPAVAWPRRCEGGRRQGAAEGGSSVMGTTCLLVVGVRLCKGVTPVASEWQKTLEVKCEDAGS